MGLYMDRIIIDVREPLEFKMGHVKGAINIPPSQMMAGAKKIDGVPKDTELVLYCISGSRSNVSINILQGLGYTNLTNGMNRARVEATY